MIGVQCLLMICRGHIRVSKGGSQKKIVVDSSILKVMSKSGFSLLSSFAVQFKRVINGLGGQN